MRLDGELKRSKAELESIKLKLHEFTVEKDELRLINERAHEELSKKETDIKDMSSKIADLEHNIKTKVAEVEEQYMRKFNNS